MICKELTNEIITRFGYRRPTPSENEDFKQTLQQYRKKGGAMSGTRAADLAIEAGIIGKRLPDIFSRFFKLPPAQVIGRHLSREDKVAIVMYSLKEELTTEFDEVITHCSGPIVEFLKTVGSGIRTAVMVIALNYKMIARKLDTVSIGVEDKFQKLSNSGLEVIKEIAGLPQQGIFYSFLNFLSNRDLTEGLKSDEMILNNKFDESKFEFADNDYGVSYSSLDDYEKLYKQKQAMNPTFMNIFKDSLKSPVFGCPAKRISIDLVIDDKEQSVNYVEAIYKLSEKQVKPIFC